MMNKRKFNQSTSEPDPARSDPDESLEAALEDSFPASDPVSAVQPTVSGKASKELGLFIKTHDKSDIVELSDGSKWRIWPGDLPITLEWLPTTRILVEQGDDGLCSHVLIEQRRGCRVRAISASKRWPVEAVQQALGDQQ